jgi:hypothetical protein
MNPAKKHANLPNDSRSRIARSPLCRTTKSITGSAGISLTKSIESGRRRIAFMQGKGSDYLSRIQGHELKLLSKDRPPTSRWLARAGNRIVHQH